MCGICFSAPAIAQVSGGNLSGTISDPSGRLVPQALVAIQNIETGITTTVTANSDGYYIAANLHPGEYQVTVSAKGFATEVRKGISLSVGAQQVIDLTLQVESAAHTVVEGTTKAPAVQLASSDITTGELHGRSFRGHLYDRVGGRLYLQGQINDLLRSHAKGDAFSYLSRESLCRNMDLIFSRVQVRGNIVAVRIRCDRSGNPGLNILNRNQCLRNQSAGGIGDCAGEISPRHLCDGWSRKTNPTHQYNRCQARIQVRSREFSRRQRITSTFGLSLVEKGSPYLNEELISV